MRRIALLAAVALVATAGGARGDTFTVAPNSFSVLPSAETPNVEEAVPLSLAWLQPPAQAAELSYEELQRLWEAAGAAYGIPWQILAAINKIESDFGRNMGPSSAGAIGWMQFMPSTWLRWGMDGDGDGIADPWDPQDAVYSAARYLAAAGGRTDLPRAIFAYNHAQWYVEDVLELARLYGDGAPAAEQPAPAQPAEEAVVFTLDRLQLRLEAAQRAVAKWNGLYQPAAGGARALEQHEADLLEQAASTPLLSDRLELQKEAVLLSLQREQAQAEADRLRAALEEAQAQLEQTREGERAASFHRAAAKVLAAPAYEQDWVFPVGGGPESVSVSRWHHDYPAADIAAPMGAPLYALSAGRVLHSWSYPDARCGIGFTMQTNDGQVWTYCHLSYLDPAVVDGAELAAGQPVGLLGSTGNSTGPHLHLQLQPATSYPQEQPWFEAFAGTAFRWQEDAPEPAGATLAEGLVFQIVQSACARAEPCSADSDRQELSQSLAVPAAG